MQIIGREQDLDAFIQHVETQKEVSCDTEFVRVRTYYPELALIQMATVTQVALIDPLLIKDFTPLKRLFENKEIVKIFHAPRQDIELLRHALDIKPHNIFDTQIGAALLGLPDQIGYEAMTREFLEIQLDKSSQFTDWLMRPLSEAQLSYAAADVTHLLQIYHLMHERLGERLDWAHDLCRPYDSDALYEIDLSPLFIKWAGRVKKDEERARLWSILQWREARAQKINRPRLWIMKDADMLAIARGETDDVPPGLRGKLKPDEAEMQDEALQILKSRTKPLNDRQKQLFSDVRGRCNTIAQELHIPPRFLATKSELEHYARCKEAPAGMENWKNQLFWERLKEPAVCATLS